MMDITGKRETHICEKRLTIEDLNYWGVMALIWFSVYIYYFLQFISFWVFNYVNVYFWCL